ncbi:Hsp70 family protein, partial [Mycolicibacterium pulveris]|uniref:Hsp70 family protein n=1 Tax=Mycolicibacterium pulveris TaxID=36813 RepID=UPI003CF69746
MSDSLGLSIGMTNLVAARIGRPPVMRRSILTLFHDRPAEVGLPSQYAYDPNRPGLVLSGFVERVGDPVPLVAADGSPHRGEYVLVEALDAMARTVGGGAPVAIAVPAHWGPGTVGALRGALRTKPSLMPDGTPPALIPDSVAALASLQAAPGLPADGVIVLVDLGGSGTSITLTDAASNFDPVGETVRYPEFSGDLIDQALLNHVTAGIAASADADPTGTLGLGSLARLRDEARQAKERLSAETATAVRAELPGFSSDVRVTRSELEQLIAAPLAGLLDTIEETLQRNNIAPASISAVATVGGGANIPLVTAQLSERLRAPVVTTPQSQLNVAAGAALVADKGIAADAPTGLAPAADAPTSMAAAAWAAGAAGVAAAESASDGAASATFRALAWSQDDSQGEPVPYAGEDYTFDQGATGARPQMAFAHEEEAFTPEPEPLPWYKRPPILFGAAAAAALLAVGGLAVTLTGTSSDTTPVTETATTVETGPSPQGPPTTVAPQTITVTGTDGQPTTSVVPPPPP